MVQSEEDTSTLPRAFNMNTCTIVGDLCSKSKRKLCKMKMKMMKKEENGKRTWKKIER